MKKIKCLILIVVILTEVTGYSQVRDKNVIVRNIFDVLKNKDEEGFVKLFPNAATIKSLMNTFIKADSVGNITESIKAFFEELTDSSMQQRFREDFRKNIKQGELNGVDWSRADFISFTSDSSMIIEDGMNTTRLKGKIYFDVGDKKYFIAFNEVIWFSNEGWYGVRIGRIDERNSEGEADVDSWEYDKDSIEMAIDTSVLAADSIAIAVEERPVKKPKTPVKEKPIRNNKQPPAHKLD